MRSPVPTGSPRAGSAASSPATAWRANEPSSRVLDAPPLTNRDPLGDRRRAPPTGHYLAARGLDAGPETIAWHLAHVHHLHVSPATVSRYLTRHGLVVPTPSKRPKSSYTRFQADRPNECWQADFTHYGLTCPDGKPGADIEILTWLDDCSRYALRVTAHPAVSDPWSSPASDRRSSNTASRVRR